MATILGLREHGELREFYLDSNVTILCNLYKIFLCVKVMCRKVREPPVPQWKPGDIIISVHNSSCGKVMFLHLSVILFTGGRGVPGGMHGKGVCMQGHAWQKRWPLQQTVQHGRGVWQGWGMHGRGCVVGACMVGFGGGVPSRRDGHCSVQYASYWNAFLFVSKFGNGLNYYLVHVLDCTTEIVS